MMKNLNQSRQLAISIQVLLVSILVLLFSTTVFADSIRSVEYEYDGAGNLIGIRSQTFLNPPDVVELSPATVNLGESVLVTATGTDLLESEVTVAEPGLTISSVTSSENQVNFVLTAGPGTSTGTATIMFSTLLGSDTETMVVAEGLPEIQTVPSPLVVSANGRETPVELVIQSNAVTDHTYDLSIADSALASITPASIVVPAGVQTRFTVMVTGLQAGASSLGISVDALDFNTSFSLRVTEPFVGNGINFSSAVGVSVGDSTPTVPSADYLFSSPVGAVVGITVINAVIGTDNAAAGTFLEITGFNLQQVRSLVVEPAQGVTIGTLSVNNDGTVLTAPVLQDAAAALVGRRIIVTAADGNQVRFGPLRLSTGG